MSIQEEEKSTLNITTITVSKKTKKSLTMVKIKKDFPNWDSFLCALLQSYEKSK